MQEIPGPQDAVRGKSGRVVTMGCEDIFHGDFTMPLSMSKIAMENGPLRAIFP